MRSISDGIGIPTGVNIRLFELIYYIHLLLAQLKVSYMEVFNDALLGLGFWEHNEAVLKTPPQSHLSNRLFVSLCDSQNCLAFEEMIVTPGQWRICLNSDSMLSAKFDSIPFPEKWVYFELVDGRLHF